MKAAQQSDWNTKEFPTAIHELPFDRVFTHDEMPLLQLGLIPEQMEDKWFIYHDSDTLHFHRSWTGHKIFEVSLSPAGNGIQVKKVLVNRDPAEYTQPDDQYNVSLLHYLIDRLLLNKDIPFTTPASIEPDKQPFYQHAVVGHGRSNKERNDISN